MEHIDGQSKYTELGAVLKALEAQFDTPTHQKQTKLLALSPTMDDIMQKHSCKRIAALKMLYREVSSLNKQFLKVECRNEFKTQVLVKIIEQYEWSRTVEEEVMQDKLFYGVCIQNVLPQLSFENTKSLKMDLA